MYSRLGWDGGLPVLWVREVSLEELMSELTLEGDGALAGEEGSRLKQ